MGHCPTRPIDPGANVDCATKGSQRSGVLSAGEGRNVKPMLGPTLAAAPDR